MTRRGRQAIDSPKRRSESTGRGDKNPARRGGSWRRGRGEDGEFSDADGEEREPNDEELRRLDRADGPDWPDDDGDEEVRIDDDLRRHGWPDRFEDCEEDG